MASSLFSAVPLAPRDPILGVTEAYNADTRPTKVNLGVGVYYDENGKLPLLECVRTAEDQLNALHAPRGYLPIDGIALYDQAVQKLLFGAQSPVITGKRAITAEALGGTGGLKIGADLLRRSRRKARRSTSATPAGKITGPSSKGQASRSRPTRTTTPPPTVWTSTGCSSA